LGGGAVILLDTHIWVWWVQDDPRLTAAQPLAYPGIRLLDLTPHIAVDSTQLPGVFHRDPADQIIVATARVYDISLLTADQRILDYPHVRTLV
jgi:PIN domain nuclease of toxin-antitoxin system